MRVTASFVSLYKYKKREINEGLISSVTRLMYKTCVVWCHDAEASHALTRLYLLIALHTNVTLFVPRSFLLSHSLTHLHTHTNTEIQGSA